MFIHGYYGTPEYRSWSLAKNRVTNPNDAYFHRYGGRGIKMCQRWLDNFQNFIADMGDRPSAKHSLDRINNNGNYCPENCRWATPREQADNTSQIKPFYARSPQGRWYKGKSHNVFASEHNLCRSAISATLRGCCSHTKGWVFWYA